MYEKTQHADRFGLFILVAAALCFAAFGLVN